MTADVFKVNKAIAEIANKTNEMINLPSIKADGVKITDLTLKACKNEMTDLDCTNQNVN